MICTHTHPCKRSCAILLLCTESPGGINIVHVTQEYPCVLLSHHFDFVVVIPFRIQYNILQLEALVRSPKIAVVLAKLHASCLTVWSILHQSCIEWAGWNTHTTHRTFSHQQHYKGYKCLGISSAQKLLPAQSVSNRTRGWNLLQTLTSSHAPAHLKISLGLFTTLAKLVTEAFHNLQY